MKPRAPIETLSTELIEEIFKYLTEGDKESACIALAAFFRCTTSVVYHVNAINTSRKRKRGIAASCCTAAKRFALYRANVWQMMLNPEDAARLRSITLLQPFDYDFSNDQPRSQFVDVRKYRHTALVEKDSQVDRVLEIIRQNASQLRYFETTLLRPLKPLLQALDKLVELKIPSTTTLQDHSLPSLRRLTIVHSSMTNPPAALPSIESLTRLEIQLQFNIVPYELPDFVDLDGYPNLLEVLLTGTNTARIFGHGLYPDPTIFRGSSRSLRYVAVHGPFIFESFESLQDWLEQLSAKTLYGLSLNGIKFGYSPHDDPRLFNHGSWPAMPELRSLELLGGMDVAYFRALPCYGLRKLFVSASFNTDAALTQLLETAAEELTALSITEHEYPRFHVFSTAFSNALNHCLKLRHLEIVGGYCFEPKEWRVLCRWVFSQLHQLHMEARPSKLCGHQHNLDVRSLASSSTPFSRSSMDMAEPLTGTAGTIPPHLQELYDGRMYITPALSGQWVHGEHVKFDRPRPITHFLLQQFRLQADIEGDLQPVRVNLGLSGWKELGFVPSPRAS